MNFQKIIAMNKFILNRGYSYIGTLGIGFVVASELQRHAPFNKLPIYVLFPIGVMLIWFIGVIDVKFNFFSEEAKYSSKKNPFWEEFKTDLKKGH